MSCYAKLRIINSFFLCAIFLTINCPNMSGLCFVSSGTNVSSELHFRVTSDSLVSFFFFHKSALNCWD